MSPVTFLATCSGCGVCTESFETEEALDAHMLAADWKHYRPRYVLWKFCGACRRVAGEAIEAAMRQPTKNGDFGSEVALVTSIQELVRGRKP